MSKKWKSVNWFSRKFKITHTLVDSLPDMLRFLIANMSVVLLSKHTRQIYDRIFKYFTIKTKMQ
jgi:hypothetical protein